MRRTLSALVLTAASTTASANDMLPAIPEDLSDPIAGPGSTFTEVRALRSLATSLSLKGTSNTGHALKSVKTGSGGGISIGFGRGAELGRRTEIEIGFETVDLRNAASAGATIAIDGDLSTAHAVYRATYARQIHTRITGSVSGALGGAYHEGAIHSAADYGGAVSGRGQDLALSAGFGAGLSYELAHSSDIVVRYRWRMTTGVKIGSYDLSYRGHALAAGLRFRF